MINYNQPPGEMYPIGVMGNTLHVTLPHFMDPPEKFRYKGDGLATFWPHELHPSDAFKREYEGGAAPPGKYLPGLLAGALNQLKFSNRMQAEHAGLHPEAYNGGIPAADFEHPNRSGNLKALQKIYKVLPRKMDTDKILYSDNWKERLKLSRQLKHNVDELVNGELQEKMYSDSLGNFHNYMADMMNPYRFYPRIPQRHIPEYKDPYAPEVRVTTPQFTPQTPISMPQRLPYR